MRVTYLKSALLNTAVVLLIAFPLLVNAQSVVPSIRDNLRLGMTGEQVRVLQDFLRKWPAVYPEGIVTGYFGRLTFSAVKTFQSVLGIEPVGIVGPKTKATLNTLMLAAASAAGQEHRSDKAQNSSDNANPATPAIPVTPATPATPGTPATPATPAIPDTPATPATPAIPATPAVPAQQEPEIPPEDLVAPVISNIVVQNIGTSSARLAWDTDEPSSSSAIISTSMTFETFTTASSSLVLVESHSLDIVDLAASTTYYFAVSSSDAEGNLSTADVQSFSTLNSTDAIPSGGQYSLSLDSDSQQFLHIEDRDQNELDMGDTMTVEAWVKLESTGQNFVIVSKEDDSSSLNQDNYRFEWTPTRLRFVWTLLGRGGYNTVVSEASLAQRANEWVHVAIVFGPQYVNGSYDGSYGAFYINGVRQPKIPPLESTGPNTGNIANSSPVVVGAGMRGASDHLSGSIDDLRIWNTARTAQEISRDFRNERSGAESGLVGYWKFNSELIDGKAKDSSQNGNHLTLNNGPVFTADTPFETTAPPSSTTTPPVATTTPPIATSTPPVATSTPPTATSSSPSTKFSIGNTVQTTANLNVRDIPSTSGQILGTQASSSLGTVIGGPTNADGYNWWNINYNTGADGWSVENYLVATSTATSIPPPPPSPPSGDPFGPRIINISISPTSINAGDLVTFTVTADDPDGIGSIVYDIRYPLRPGSSSYYYLRPNCNFLGRTSGSCTFSEPIDHGIQPTLYGEYVITTVRAGDYAGNVSIYYPNGTVAGRPETTHSLTIPVITVNP